jgi:hypothetical protein
MPAARWVWDGSPAIWPSAVATPGCTYPLATSLLLSLVATIVLNLLLRR